MIVEMYDAARNVRKSKMLKMKEFSPLPWLHINVDLWTSKTSAVKYIGDCIFFSRTCRECCSLLASVSHPAPRPPPPAPSPS